MYRNERRNQLHWTTKLICIWVGCKLRARVCAIAIACNFNFLTTRWIDEQRNCRKKNMSIYWKRARCVCVCVRVCEFARVKLSIEHRQSDSDRCASGSSSVSARARTCPELVGAWWSQNSSERIYSGKLQFCFFFFYFIVSTKQRTANRYTSSNASNDPL